MLGGLTSAEAEKPSSSGVGPSASGLLTRLGLHYKDPSTDQGEVCSCICYEKKFAEINSVSHIVRGLSGQFAKINWIILERPQQFPTIHIFNLGHDC